MDFEFEERHYSLNLLDLFYNYQLITDKQYSFYNFIKKKYKKYIINNSYFNFDVVKTTGGKSFDKTEDIFDLSRDYLKIKRIVKEDLTLFENTIFINKQYKYFLNERKDIYDFIYHILELMDLIFEKYKNVKLS